MRKTIVVGVEDLPYSDDALVWAAKAAEQRRAVLHIVHATGFPSLGIDLLYDDALVQGGNTLVEQAAQRVAEVAPAVEVTTTLDRRLPGEALSDLAKGAEMLVIGTHRMGAMERVFAGSLSYQIAAGAPCPVVVIPNLPALDATGVVVGVDGSADSLDAVALAAAEADWTGQPLHIIHAWQEPGIYASTDIYPVGIAESVRESERLVLAESAAGLADKYPDLVVHEQLAHDQPATALLDFAADARLLVVGSRGRHGIARVLLGSVSHTIVLHAPCPVMVARYHDHDHDREVAEKRG